MLGLRWPQNVAPKKDNPKLDFTVGLLIGLLLGAIIGSGLNTYIVLFVL